MSSWWVRFPLDNVELYEDVPLGPIRIRHLCTGREARREGPKWHYHNPVHTVDAIVAVPRHDSETNGVADRAWERLAPLHDALRFLMQRDIWAGSCAIHEDPECKGEPLDTHVCIRFCNVMYQPKIQVIGDWHVLLSRASALWADDDADERTAFRYAVRLQHAAMARQVPLEVSFMLQWIAFEVLFNRWCDTDDAAPEDSKDMVVPKGTMCCVRREVKRTLTDLVDAGTLCARQRDSIMSACRSPLRSPAAAKGLAFIESFGVADADHAWVQGGCEIRNALAHGRSLTDAYEHRPQTERDTTQQDLRWRTLRTRSVVNRFVMSLMGYEPREWDLHACVSPIYRTVTADHGSP